MCVLCGRPEDSHQDVTTAELATAATGNSGGKTVISDAALVTRLQDPDGAWTPGEVIGYSFLTSRPAGSTGSDYTGFNTLTAAQKETVRLALSLWADVANLDFVENASSSVRQGQITFANSSSIADGVWGFAYTSGQTRPLWINFDGTKDTWSGNVAGSYDLMALMHEIGHTLGLVHPSDYNASDSGDDITYAANAEFYQDSYQYTIMSYFSATNTGANYGRKYASTPMIYDLLAVQDYYGRNYDTRSGDTVYGFNSTANRSVFDFTVNGQPILTIWDGGGHNKLDLSGFSTVANVDLRPGSYSDAGGLTRNLAIAYAAFISDVVTGSGTDAVRDNALANRIGTGSGDDVITLYSGGNDTVDGGAGTDTVQLLGSSSDYRVITNSDGTLTLKGPTGSLLIGNVENFQFKGSVTLTRDQVAALDFNGLEYIASNPDLIRAFGNDAAAAKNHWLSFGVNEGRSLDSFDPLQYLANNKDLIAAFGLDPTAATQHYVSYGYKEGRATTGFDALAYIASDASRIDTIGYSVVGGEIDYILNGAAKGATISFSGLSYIASYADLRAVFGLNAAAGVDHYLNYGYKEYRSVLFDPLDYLASNADLIRAFGADTNAAYAHYFNFGAAEGRSIDLFNAYDYAGSNPDLVNVYGYDTAALTRHYLTNGFLEGRSAAKFDVVAYAMTNNITGDNWQERATKAYLAATNANGTPFGTDQTGHDISVGKAVTGDFANINDNDWFIFHGAAYTTYTVKLEFLNQSGSTSTQLAELLLRGHDNVIVVDEYGRYQSLSVEIFTQEAEDVYLELQALSSLAKNYRLTITAGGSSTASAMVADAASAAPEVTAENDNGLNLMAQAVTADDYWL